MASPSTMDKNWVKPSEPLVPHTIVPAPMEQYAPRNFTTLLFFFPISDGVNVEHVHGRLAQGLGQTMVQVPVLAGRAENHPDGDGKIQIRVDEHAGAHLLFRDDTCSTINQPIRHDFPTYEHLKWQNFSTRDLTPMGQDFLQLPAVTEGSALFYAQAIFIRGGLILAASISHIMADGVSMEVILHCWARNTRLGKKAGDYKLGEIHAFDRENLRNEVQSGSLPESCPYVMTEKTADALFMLKKLPPREDVGSWSSDSVTERNKWYSLVTWYVSAENVERLKNAAAPPPDATDAEKEEFISATDARTAFLWYHTVLARRLSSKGYNEAKCYFTINERPRLSPSLSYHYVGNAAHLLSVKCDITELESQHPDYLLRKLTRQIRGALRDWKESDYRRLVGLCSSMPANKALTIHSSPRGDPNLLIVDMSKSGAYGWDWGEGLGYADRLRGVTPASYANQPSFWIMPSMPDGGVEVSTSFGLDVTENLKEDVGFTEYAEFRG